MSNARHWKDRLATAINKFTEVVDLESSDDEADRLFNNVVAILTAEISQLEQDKTDLIGQMNMSKLDLDNIDRWFEQEDMAGVNIPISAALSLSRLQGRLRNRRKAIEERQKKYVKPKGGNP